MHLGFHERFVRTRGRQSPPTRRGTGAGNLLITQPRAHSMSDMPIRERRRGERVIIRIPVILYGLTKDNRHISEEAETVAISRTGALVRSRSSFKTGGVIEVTNSFSKQADKFRVVW